MGWNSEEWRNRYLKAIIDFAEFCGRPAFAVEFHPSRKNRSKNHFEDFIIEALSTFKEFFGGECPFVYVENRTNLYISTVKDIICLYEEICDRTSKRENEKFGFSIDVMQLYSQMGISAIEELPKIPVKAIKNWHIHYRHQPPNTANPINWKKITDYLIESQPAILLPEVFTNQGVRETIEFIEGLVESI